MENTDIFKMATSFDYKSDDIAAVLSKKLYGYDFSLYGSSDKII